MDPAALAPLLSSDELGLYLRNTSNFAVVCVINAVLVVLVMELLKYAFRGLLVQRFLRDWERRRIALLDEETGHRHASLAREFRRHAESLEAGGTDAPPGLREKLEREFERRCAVPRGEGEESGEPLFRFEPFVFSLPVSKFMKEAQNATDHMQQYPAERPFALLALAGSRSHDDVLAVAGAARELAALPGAAAEGHAAADPHVAESAARLAVAIDRRLDTLQLKLMQYWLAVMRGSALVVGVSVTFVLAGLFDADLVPPNVSPGEFFLGTVAAVVMSGLVLALLPRETGMFAQDRSRAVLQLFRGVAPLLPMAIWFLLMLGPDAMIGALAPEGTTLSQGELPPNVLLLLVVGLVSGLSSSVIYDMVQRLTGAGHG